ncbi:reprolysin-like metallopeptidase [Neolewinella antarctica]|uniref:Peptidase M12B domain-containing protein n=1 Tax=Neolewinella antarctica TaxID=442734 RepID=A0ABX0XAK2_9BACT|nr:M12 family metallo-peptidase [Neolewinella antarctica]NJC25984.1 hypothetical protein [Neolewinella antarctica]
MNFFYTLSVLLFSSMLAAQYAPFSPLQANDRLATKERALTDPTEALYFSTEDPAELADFLAAVTEEGDATSGELSLLELPAPDGSVATFRLQRYQMIQPELQVAYPGYVTLYGWDVKNPGRRVQLDWTGRGFGASVMGGAEGHWSVSPLSAKRIDRYQSYFVRDVPQPEDGTQECGFIPDEKLLAELRQRSTEKQVGDCELREYRLALACTGEYYAAVGGTQALAVSEMMRAVNRLNQIFVAEISLQLTIINLPVAGGGVELVYDDPNSDPYTNDDSGEMLNENLTTINAVIGADNYDIGHVFGTGGGGVAQVASVCRNGKARGVSGSRFPDTESFYGLVAHEMGHQFGASHTYNSNATPNCGRNRSTDGSSAYEIGGGSTIMSYAGICGQGPNVQSNRDLYYHAESIQQIADYMESGGGAACATTVSTANIEPTANAGADYTIPASTPFVLTAGAANDGDGDGVTYCWEQFDLGPPVTNRPTGSEVEGPLFRSLPPSTENQRYFPNLPDLIAGDDAPWEILPTVSREMNFVVTVRDFGAAGYACLVQDGMTIDVVDTGAPFAVTVPNGSETYLAGSTQSLTWNVAGTNAGAINCAQVDLVLSLDGGLTFTENIGTVANTGTAAVTLPSVTARDVRLMVKCADNIFLDVSDQDFAIEQSEYVVRPVEETAEVCDGGNTAEFTFELESLMGYTGTINYAAQDLPTGANVTFSPASTTLAANGVTTVAIIVDGLSSLAANNYPFTVRTNDGNAQKTANFVLEVLPALEPPTLLTPVANGFIAPGAATFDWSDVSNIGDADGYSFNLYRDAAGTQRVINPVFTGRSRVNFGSNLDRFLTEDEVYWWSVTARNTECDPTQTAAASLIRFVFAEEALPVEWLSFEARPTVKTAELTWSVRQDDAHEHFVIERSDNPQAGWLDVGKVVRQGLAGDANYAFTDRAVAADATYFYRLCQVDTDGDFSHSQIETVAFAAGLRRITLYPNPVTQRLFIGAVAGAGEVLEYQLITSLGRVVRSGILGEQRSEVNVADLPSAVYQVVVTNGTDFRETYRVVKR